jgi:glycosyltransferase involved in cell wall biosynthesis
MKHNRILIFSTDDHLYPAGGAEQAMGNITERLPHIEFDLICAKLRKGAKAYEQVKNVHIHRMGFGVPKLDGFILALFGHFCARKLMKKHQYDLMWSIMASYGAFSAARVKKKTGLPFLLTLQEGDALQYIYERVKYVRGSFNEIFRVADGIQAISTFLLTWGRALGYSGKYGIVIPNGVNIDAFTQQFDQTDILRTRASFGFKDDAFILITSSRFVRKNGIRYVIEALERLPEQVHFVICGSGELEQEIRAQVGSLGLGHRVLFKGFVDPKELPLLMKASDAFIRPSLSEGLGTAFLEAMAARIPVIGTDVGGIKDFLRDGETGFVVRPEDPQSIVNAVERVRTLPTSLRCELIDRCEHMVRERYNWNLVSKNMETFFNTLTS